MCVFIVQNRQEAEWFGVRVIEFYTYETLGQCLCTDSLLLSPTSKAGNSREYPSNPLSEQPPYALCSWSAETTKGSGVEIDQCLFILDVAKDRGRRLPAPSFGFCSCGLAHLGPELGILQLLQALDVVIRVTWLDKEASLLIINNCGDATSLAADDRDTGSHTFQNDKSQRLGITGHDEGVGRGKCRAEIIATQLAREDSLGSLEVLVQFLLLRSTTDDAKPGVGHALEHGLDVLEALLCAETSYVNHQEIVGVAIRHLAPPFVRLEFGVEPLGVDSLAPNIDTGDTIRGKLIAHLRAGNEGQIGTRVDEAEKEPGKLLNAGNESKIILSVTREVGVITNDKRDAHHARIEKSRHDHETTFVAQHETDRTKSCEISVE